MIKKYEKTIEELNKYNEDGQLFIGIEDFSDEDFLFDLNNIDNIAITGRAGSGKTVLLESLLYQLTNKQKTNKQKTMNNLFMIDEHPSDYRHFIERGAKVANTYIKSPDKKMPIDHVLEAAYDNFKAGNSTIFVVEQLDRIKRYTKKDLTHMLKEMIASKNAIVILVDFTLNSLNESFDTHFKAYDSDENGHFFLEGFENKHLGVKYISIIKPPYVRLKR